MVQRFFLDGVDTEAAGASVADQFDLVIEPLANVAKSALSLAQVTVPRAQVALQTAVVEAVPIACFDYGFRHGVLFRLIWSINRGCVRAILHAMSTIEGST